MVISFTTAVVHLLGCRASAPTSAEFLAIVTTPLHSRFSFSPDNISSGRSLIAGRSAMLPQQQTPLDLEQARVRDLMRFVTLSLKPRAFW